RNVLELTSLGAVLEHQGDGELAVVEMPAEFVTVVVEHDRARAHGIGVAIEALQLQHVFEEGYESIPLVEDAQRRTGTAILIAQRPLGRVHPYSAGIPRRTTAG